LSTPELETYLQTHLCSIEKLNSTLFYTIHGS
jgi:hypothetical protein